MMKNEENPVIVYKYENTIRNIIFNYKSTAQKYKAGDEEAMICNCYSLLFNSIYKDPHHGHIVTGDLNIIENIKLRNLFIKGHNYREPKFFWTITGNN